MGNLCVRTPIVPYGFYDESFSQKFADQVLFL